MGYAGAIAVVPTTIATLGCGVMTGKYIIQIDHKLTDAMSLSVVPDIVDLTFPTTGTQCTTTATEPTKKTYLMDSKWLFWVPFVAFGILPTIIGCEVTRTSFQALKTCYTTNPYSNLLKQRHSTMINVPPPDKAFCGIAQRHLKLAAHTARVVLWTGFTMAVANNTIVCALYLQNPNRRDCLFTKL
jgi:hypothetical protein